MNSHLINNSDYTSFKRITFLLRNPGYFRNIEWLIKTLIDDFSCDIRVIIGGIQSQKKLKMTLDGLQVKNKERGIERKEAIQELKTRYPEVHFSTNYPVFSLGAIATSKKLSVDNLFFLQEATVGNTPARDRLGIRLTKIQQKLLSQLTYEEIAILILKGEKSLIKSVNRSNQLRKMASEVVKFDSDLVCVIPCVGDANALLLGLSSNMVGLPSIGLIASWDNLTIKGKYLNVFSKTICWSNFQIKELTKLHGYEKSHDKFRAVGFYPFAHRLKYARQSQYHQVLQSDLVNVTWFMSSGFISNNSGSIIASFTELDLIGEFISHLNKTRPVEFNRLKLVFRLHPQNSNDVNYLEFFQNLKLISKVEFIVDSSGEPIGDLKRESYDKLLLETDICVGLATTAVFEAALLGKRTIAPPGILSRRSFQQMSHGSYLKSSNGGPVLQVEDWSEFLEAILNPSIFIPSDEFLDWTIPQLHAKTLTLAASEILSTEITPNVPIRVKPKEVKYGILWILLYTLGSISILNSVMSKTHKKIVFFLSLRRKRLQKKIVKSFRVFHSIARNRIRRTRHQLHIVLNSYKQIFKKKKLRNFHFLLKQKLGKPIKAKSSRLVAAIKIYFQK